MNTNRRTKNGEGSGTRLHVGRAWGQGWGGPRGTLLLWFNVEMFLHIHLGSGEREGGGVRDGGWLSN